jgi:hypothetical protein
LDPVYQVRNDGCYNNGQEGGNNHTHSARFHVSGVTLVGGAVGFHFSSWTGHHQLTGSFVSHVNFRNISKYGIWIDDIYGLDNNLFSYLRFDHCGIAFYQHAPDSQRAKPGGRCLQAFNNPSLGYMDKVVFYRVDVTNCETGWQLEPCRADNGNFWIENTMENVTGSGWVMSNNGGDGIVSSLATNVGMFVGDAKGGGSGLSILNRYI